MSSENTNPEKENWYMFYSYDKNKKSFEDIVADLKERGTAPFKEFNIDGDHPVYSFHFYVLTEMEMKNYKFNYQKKVPSEVLMTIELSEDLVRRFGKGKLEGDFDGNIEKHGEKSEIICLRNLYQNDILPVSDCKFFDLDLSYVTY